VLRAVFENKDPGDLFVLANPEEVDLLREKICRNVNAGRPE
jgi:hypothetical protein